MSLPDAALQAVVDAVRCHKDNSETRYRERSDALNGLRGTCRQLRAEVNARTRSVSPVAACLLLAPSVALCQPLRCMRPIDAALH